MKTNTNVKPTPEEAELLSRMARAACPLIDSIHDCDVYQVAEAWQREVLLAEPGMAAAHDYQSFKTALTDPDTASVFVKKGMDLSQEMAESLLARNPLIKTVFWEI